MLNGSATNAQHATAPALVMTQQMHLAFKLLTFSNAELIEYVERVGKQPLLERDEREFAPVAAEGDARPLRHSGINASWSRLNLKAEQSRPDEEFHTLMSRRSGR